MHIEKIIPFALLAAVLLVAGLWLKHQAHIDACLDKGDRWDYERKQCRSSDEANEEANK